MNQQLEVWDDVPGFDGYYSVSTLGQVKSERSGKILRCNAKDGNKQVQFSVNGVKSKHYVSRLVAETFIGEITPGCVAIHINKNKSDNRLSNIKIDTYSESGKINYERNVMQDWGISSVPILRSSAFFAENGFFDDEGNIERLTCKSCKEEKPISDFYKKGKTVQHKCKTCVLDHLGVTDIGKGFERKSLALRGVRICSICKKEKVLEVDFCKNKTAHLGRSHNCKECSIKLNAFYKERREKQKLEDHAQPV